MSKEEKKEDQFAQECPYEVKFSSNNTAQLNTEQEVANIVFHVGEAPQEILKFTEDKMFLRGKETECPQDIIDGMRAWLKQWNYIASPPVEPYRGVTVCKDTQEGELILIIDNDDMLARLSVNPWTMKISNFKYCIRNE